MARRGENIHKRKDGRWEGRYIKARTPDRRICWGYIYGTTYAEVKQRLIHKKSEYGGFQLIDAHLTFTELAEAWLQSVKCGLKESTYAHYQYTLYKYVLPILGTVPISRLEENILEQALQKIIAPPDGQHKELGFSSARECLSMVRRICKYAVHLRLIRPMELSVRLPQEKSHSMTPLSAVEQNRLRTYVLSKVVIWLSPSEYIFKTQIENLKRQAPDISLANVHFYTYAKLMCCATEELEAIAGLNPTYIILDEFHRVGAECWGASTLELLKLCPDAKILGLSATNIRYLDNNRDMAEELFDGHIASEMTLGEAIVRGILPAPKYVTTVYQYQKELTRYQNRIDNLRSAGIQDVNQKYLDALRRALEKADGLDEVFARHALQWYQG